MSNLRCYQNSTDTVIAESADDARAVYAEHIGAVGKMEANVPFWPVPDDTPIKINFDDAPPGEEKMTQTAAEWAAQSGRSFLCSTEF